MAMDLTETQQLHFDKIQNTELKALVEQSYTFFTMTDEEKNDFLIWMSIIHQDKKAESEVMKTLGEEIATQDKIITDPENFKPDEQEGAKQDGLLKEDYIEAKGDVENLKKAVRKEQEVDQKHEDKGKMDNLMEELNKV